MDRAAPMRRTKPPQNGRAQPGSGDGVNRRGGAASSASRRRCGINPILEARMAVSGCRETGGRFEASRRTTPPQSAINPRARGGRLGYARRSPAAADRRSPRLAGRSGARQARIAHSRTRGGLMGTAPEDGVREGPRRWRIFGNAPDQSPPRRRTMAMAARSRRLSGAVADPHGGSRRPPAAPGSRHVRESRPPPYG